jgi:MFS family permease
MMREVVLLFVAVAFLGLSQGFADNLINNFCATIGVSVETRTVMEPFRELPGLLIMFIIAGISFLTIGRMGAIAMMTRAAGLLLIGLFVGNYSPLLVVFLVVGSLGDHIFMPLRNSIGITVANYGYEGRVIGFMDATTMVMTIVAGIFILLFSNATAVQDYHVLYVFGAAAAFCAGIAFFFMRTHRTDEKLKKARLVFKKKYRLYYIISFISGMRKQIYLMFAPLFLITAFGQSLKTVILIGIAGSVVVFFFNPFIGRMIDRHGERKLLVGGGVVCTAIYVVYAFLAVPGAESALAIGIFWALTFVDRMTQSTLMGRDIYVKHSASSPDEIMPTLSVGVSMDHVASVTAPIFGGLLWAAVGPQWVFAAGAVIAVIYTIACFLVPGKKREAKPDLTGLPPEDNTAIL